MITKLTLDEAIQNYLYDGALRSFKDIEQSAQCIRYPRSTTWDHLQTLKRKGKVREVSDVDGKNVRYYKA